MKRRLAIDLDDVKIGSASTDIDMTRRTDAQPNALIIDGQNRDLYIIGELDRFPNFPAKDEHISSIADSELQAKGFRHLKGRTLGNDDLPGLTIVNIDEHGSIRLGLECGAALPLLNAKNEIDGIVERV